MALIDDINALPTTVGDGQTGHLQNHAIIHAALKDHETRLSARHLIGTGTPEGRIAATVGTTYTDTAATNGAIRWIKTTGTGTTGWRVEGGDTGLRNISNLISEYTSSTFGVTLERAGASVAMNLYARQFDIKGADSGDLIMTLPVGFRPTMSYRFLTQQPGGVSLQVSTNGQVTVNSGTINSGAYVTFNFMHLTRDAWPTTLPGTPA